MSTQHKGHARVPLTNPQPQRVGRERGPQSQAVQFETDARSVRQLLASKHSKAALEMAKQVHKRFATAQSESVLIEAYEGRIRALLQQGMSAEAMSLVKLVEARFPTARNRMEEVQFDIRASAGTLEEIVAPLLDPAAPAALREKTEAAIRRRVEDPLELAQLSSLPPTHPLRECAAGVAAALRAVTTGAVDDVVVSLPQVSHRGPLSPWKALVNAIACFYREDDRACQKWLQAVAADSVAARLVAPLSLMLGTGASSGQGVAAVKLVASVGAGREVMGPILASLEQALSERKRKQILQLTREAVTLCRQYCPDMTERLRQHIAIRCMLRGLEPDPVWVALGGQPRQDAYYFRLMARALEELKEGFEDPIEIIVFWEEFRQQAIKEKWFTANSAEDGVLSLRMAKIAERIPPDILEDLREEEEIMRSSRSGGVGALPSLKLLSPGALYERACRADPSPEVFGDWLKWAKTERDWRVPDRVAELWRTTRPEDVGPLLWLTESAEERGAYKRSLQFLEEAEQRDRLNPEVRNAKLRLLLAAILRHFRQRKPHLAAQGIDRIEALPKAAERDLPALAVALRRLCRGLEKDFEAARQLESELDKQLGSVAAHVLLWGLAKLSGLAASEIGLLQFEIDSVAATNLPAGVARACSLGALTGVPIPVPNAWEQPLSASLTEADHSLDAAQMLVLGEAALRGQAPQLAFAVSVAGMTKGGANARFLFLRARSLPIWASDRRYLCLCAALELARRERDTDLAGKLLDELRKSPRRMFGPDDFPYTMGRDGFSLEPELLSQVLEGEMTERVFPVPGRTSPPRYTRENVWQPESGEGDSPEARPHPGEFDGDDGDLDEDDLELAIDEILESLPPELQREMLEAMIRGEDPKKMGRKFFRAGSFAKTAQPTPKESKKPARSPSPEQGDLF
jgi:hypothetical protein